MTRVIPVLAVVLFGGACAGSGGAPAMATGPLLEHLRNVVSVSALDDAAIARLDASLEGALEQTGTALAATLDGVRATTLDALNAMVGPDSLDAAAELRMRSLLDVMNLSHAIAGAAGVELAVSQRVEYNHRCDRIGDGGVCISDTRFNCSHIDGSCFHIRKP